MTTASSLFAHQRHRQLPAAGSRQQRRSRRAPRQGRHRDLGRVDRRAHRHPLAPLRRARRRLSDLALIASRRALEAADCDPGDIDLIIVATSTPDMVFPSAACMLQAKLGVAGCAAFDVQAVCSGFVYALDGRRRLDQDRRRVEGARRRRRSVLAHPRLQGPRRPACCSATAPARSSSRRATTPGILASELHADGALRRHPVRAGQRLGRRDPRRPAAEDGRPGGVQARRRRARERRPLGARARPAAATPTSTG